jgi:DNA recombination protein Rad52
MFTDTQKASLKEPLNRSHVKSRNQGGRQVSYIEGWHAIAEANEIFGFDGWSRETVEIKCISEREREIGQNKTPGWGVSYITKVRVRVGDLIREGCGTGHGIDRDLGQAHESALKEAETDAMKRALMTFGNRFGLALYDKEQTNVCDDRKPESAPAPEITPQASAKIADRMIAELNACFDMGALNAVKTAASFKSDYARLLQADKDRIITAGGDRKAELEQAA